MRIQIVPTDWLQVTPKRSLNHKITTKCKKTDRSVPAEVTDVPVTGC
jgi:hypothetical protein